MITSIKVRAPSSTANLGPGFDVFGLALDAFYDEIIFTKTNKSITTNKPWHGIRILTTDNIPKNPQQNTAGLVIKAMKQKFKIKSTPTLVINDELFKDTLEYKNIKKMLEKLI